MSLVRTLSRVKSFGINNSLLSWLLPYLTQRSLLVAVDGIASNLRPFNGDVQKGYILGPLILLTFIDNAINSVFHGALFLFTGDVRIAYFLRPQ